MASRRVPSSRLPWLALAIALAAAGCRQSEAAPARRESGATAAAASAATSASAAAFQPPNGVVWNVVLIIIDTLRQDHLGVYGYKRHPTSPNIDRLAAKSFIFDRAYATSPWTRPSIASILSSAIPYETGIFTESPEDRLPQHFETLPEYFAKLGYVTAGWYTNPHFKFGLEQGLQERHYEPGAPASRVYPEAIDWVNRHTQTPFFLLIHNLDPHDSYWYHPEFPWAPKNSPYRLVAHMFAHSRSGVGKSCSDRPLPMSKHAIDEMRDCYDQDVAFTDEHLGPFLDTLKKDGLMSHTVVVVTADHGEEFLDHGSLWHGCTLYDELMHVPLIVYVPGQKGRRIEKPVSLLDIYPTLVQFIDPKAVADLRLDGRSLVPLMQGKPWPPRLYEMVTGFRGPIREGVQAGNFKLIRFADGHRALFDLKTDPHEKHDLSKTQFGRLLATALSAYQLHYPSTALHPRRRRPPTAGAN